MTIQRSWRFKSSPAHKEPQRFLAAVSYCSTTLAVSSRNSAEPHYTMPTDCLCKSRVPSRAFPGRLDVSVVLIKEAVYNKADVFLFGRSEHMASTISKKRLRRAP